ncbi:SRPBCC domain-containing protein [Leucobacter soli]|uniref:Activator of Hsp90 ATPase homologue 1/2-like C-terminal domain-containing protein n=1 Tax=Leucobacter soli TaxID=2812850 RepID=A0A916JWF9_9MICO|nr:SRPBCC domain-containing protein [Leucobacter soli]CAG7609282.1 hypothetical protein LEUCIP111803_01186 [Leucobacter soli]
MSNPTADPKLDLALQRVIRAPRSAVWRAWTDSARLSQWWIPAPLVTRVDRLDVRPGGAFVTQMSEDGETFTPHVDGIFLVAEKDRRLVFTNGITSALRPARAFPVSMTAHIELADHPEGTDYRVVVQHASAEDSARHAELGFFEGWGTVTEALTRLVEAEEATEPR